MKPFDLEKRTTEFGKEIIRFCKMIPVTTVSRPLISQLVRSGTSVGANYMEANNASSRKDFRNKIYICKKEIQETKYWLQMIEEVEYDQKQHQHLWQETDELNRIFQRIITSTNKKMSEN